MNIFRHLLIKIVFVFFYAWQTLQIHTILHDFCRAHILWTFIGMIDSYIDDNIRLDVLFCPRRKQNARWALEAAKTESLLQIGNDLIVKQSSFEKLMIMRSNGGGELCRDPSRLGQGAKKLEWFMISTTICLITL